MGDQRGDARMGAAAAEAEPEPEREAYELPTATRTSTVRLRSYTQQQRTGGEAAEDEGSAELAVQLVHVATPDDGRFSRSKKQCDLWEYVWAASQMLADLLVTIGAQSGENDTPLLGLRTLELGCGAGLCSLVAALGGASVVATDGVADATELVARSAALNGVAERIETRPLDWFKLDGVPQRAFDLIIVSDCLIFRGTAKPVAAAISRALRPGGTALISDPYRAPFEEFGDALDAQGLEIELRPFKPGLLASLPVNEDAAEQPGFVQHWGKQKGQLFFVHKPAEATATADTVAAAAGNGTADATQQRAEERPDGAAAPPQAAEERATASGNTVYRSADALVELRSAVAAAVDECCEPDTWYR